MDLFAIIAVIYITIVSLISIVLTVYDKIVSKKKKSRISEKTLIITSVLGGSVAMFVTMLVIRHKTMHAKFMLGVPMIFIAQFLVGVCLYFMYFLPIK